MNIGEGMSGAVFDPTGKYRYALWRFWWPEGDKLIFNGLNPSRAGRYKNDPTVRRMIAFAMSWGFAGLFVGNMYPLVTPEPREVWSSVATMGEHIKLNDLAIKRMRELSSKAMVGWGNFGARAGTRPTEVLAILGEPVYCLAVTQTGEPGHPLYLHSMSELRPYVRENNSSA